jgi:hypothetical protein
MKKPSAPGAFLRLDSIVHLVASLLLYSRFGSGWMLFAVGYGFKYASAFRDTHLRRV